MPPQQSRLPPPPPLLIDDLPDELPHTLNRTTSGDLRLQDLPKNWREVFVDVVLGSVKKHGFPAFDDKNTILGFYHIPKDAKTDYSSITFKDADDLCLTKHDVRAAQKAYASHVRAGVGLFYPQKFDTTDDLKQSLHDYYMAQNPPVPPPEEGAIPPPPPAEGDVAPPEYQPKNFPSNAVALPMGGANAMFSPFGSQAPYTTSLLLLQYGSRSKS